MIKWCHNAKTGEIFSYSEAGDLTDFPRGEFLAYGDYLTTGMGSKDEAVKWGKEWGCCVKCKAAATSDHKKEGYCFRCGTKLKFVE